MLSETTTGVVLGVACPRLTHIRKHVWLWTADSQSAMAWPEADRGHRALSSKELGRRGRAQG